MRAHAFLDLASLQYTRLLDRGHGMEALGGRVGGGKSSCDSSLLLASFPTFIHLIPLVFIEQLLCARLCSKC